VSRENVELVRGMFRDLDGVYGLIGVTAPDFVWDLTTFEGWTEQGEFHGLDAFVGFLRTWVEPYEEWNVEIESILDADGGDVVAILRQKGRLRDSDSAVELHYGIVYTIEGGLVQRARAYATPEKALEAIGLRKETT
jgi:ketosteroid isomerase-like protein